MFHIVTALSALFSLLTVRNERNAPVLPPPPPQLSPINNNNDDDDKPTDPDYLTGEPENFTLPSAYQVSDEDLEEIQEIAAILEVVKTEESILTPTRRSKYMHEYKNRENHKLELVETDQFHISMRMEVEYFDELLDELQSEITLSYCHSVNSTSGNIYPKVILACGLQYLMGDSIVTLSQLYGILIASCKQIINMELDAIDHNTTCQKLQVQLP